MHTGCATINALFIFCFLRHRLPRRKVASSMRFSNMHQHSTFSDGADPMEAVVQSAIARNFVSLGFSDHSFTPCDTSYCMKLERYNAYLAEIARLRDQYADRLEVLAGLELDYFSEADRSRFDYWIASVHYLILNDTCYPIDHSRPQQLSCIANSCGGSKLEFAKRYYDLVVRNVTRSKPDTVGHFDVITKFGIIDEDDPAYRRVALQALDEVLQICPRIEMNTGAISRGVRQTPYPNIFLLRRVREKGGEVILSSDSHRADTIDCAFPECVATLRTLGFDHIVQLRKDGFHSVAI